MTSICRGSCHFTEIGTLDIQRLSLQDYFLAILYISAISHNLSEIFEHVQNVTTVCDF